MSWRCYCEAPPACTGAKAGGLITFNRTFARPARTMPICIRRAHREIDDAAVDEGSAVVDADIDVLAVIEIGYLDPGVERQAFDAPR